MSMVNVILLALIYQYTLVFHQLEQYQLALIGWNTNFPSQLLVKIVRATYNYELSPLI